MISATLFKGTAVYTSQSRVTRRDNRLGLSLFLESIHRRDNRLLGGTLN
jgi:hypothetical protein